jgi:hypothetical protein
MRAVPVDRSYRRQVWEGGCDFVQAGWIQMVDIDELDDQMLKVDHPSCDTRNFVPRIYIQNAKYDVKGSDFLCVAVGILYPAAEPIISKL